jgi:hypothetical protein
VAFGLFRGRREEDRDRERDREDITHLIRISPELLIKYVTEDLISKPWGGGEDLSKIPSLRIFQEILKTSYMKTFSRPLEIVPVVTGSAFKEAVKNRMVIAIKAVEENITDKIDVCVSVLLDKSSDERIMSMKSECREFLNKIPFTPILGLVIAEAVVAISTFNLPIPLQSNIIKALAGYQTD